MICHDYEGPDRSLRLDPFHPRWAILPLYTIGTMFLTIETRQHISVRRGLKRPAGVIDVPSLKLRFESS